jgi:outer membrane protein OmpA-like peptidoglycan-associated protein
MRTGRIRVLTASFISMLMGGVIGLLAVPAGAVAGDLLTNGSFDTGTAGAGWSTTASGGLEVWDYSSMASYTQWTQNLATYDGPNFAELNSNEAGTLYQDVVTVPGDVLNWSLGHRARAGNVGTDVMKVLAGPGGGSGASGLTEQIPLTWDGGPIPVAGSANMPDTGAAWGVWTGSYIVPAGQTLTRFAFQAVSSASGDSSYGNFLDGIAFGHVGMTNVTVTADSPSSISASASVPSIGYVTSPATTSSDWTSEPACSVYATADSSFATPLTGVQPAGNYVTHCTGGSSGSYYVATRVDGSLTITAIPAPPPSGGGGGGGTAPETPSPSTSPSPSVSAEPSSSPPAPGTQAALDPIRTPDNPNIPAGGIPVGGSVLLVGGQPVPMTVTPNAKSDPVGLVFTAPGMTMRLEGRGDDSDPLGLEGKRVLVLQSEQGSGRSLGRWATRGVARAKAKKVLPVARSSGDGFAPGTPVKFYLLPATYMGELMNDASGAFDGDVPIPPGITPGYYTMQVNGFAPDMSVRSLSIGVKVTALSATPKNAAAKVYFESLSSVLTHEGMTTLKALVMKTGKKGVRTVSIGYVEGTTITANDKALSTRRATNVAAYLKKLGLKGRFVARGDGVATESGATARRVNVWVTYLK